MEYRNWHQGLALFLFMWAIAYVIYRIRPEISPAEFNFIYWIFLLVVSINVAIRSNSHTSSGQRILMYTLVAPGTVLISRMLFNIVYLILIAMAFYLAMLLLFYPQITLELEYVLLILSGGASIGIVLAFTSALSRHVSNQNTVLSILSIPILIPVIILLNSIGANLLMGNDLQSGKFVAIAGITMLSLALSMVLFPYIWKE